MAPSTTASAVPASATSDLIRARLGARYSLERELGRGGMGTVYLARDLRLDRPVALKVLPPEFANQVHLRERFLLETRTAASFSHPNIVPVYAVEETEDLLAYAMGLVEGETVANRVQRIGPLTVRELVRLLQDVGYALAYAHGRGVVHRDIKPDNVMLERATGRALVMDFGISRTIAPAAPGSALTRVGEVVGTPEYMSPEQASGDHVDGRSDLYALGLTAHFAATGTVMMAAETTQKVLVRQLTEEVPPIASARPDLPPVLAAAIDRCVEKDPEHRFATAEALVEEIDAGQLAEPEIPLPLRLFAGEAGTLSMVAVGIVLFSIYMVQSGIAADLHHFDVALPVVGLLAVLLTRAMTTVSEARRLAVGGFAPQEVLDGMARVVAERAQRREELRADPAVRLRRRNTIVSGVLMVPLAWALMFFALRMRTQIGPTRYDVPIGAVFMIVSSFALLGISVVLLIKSPFRMPPGELLFRGVWLGAPGRWFLRLAARGVPPAGSAGRVRTASSPTMKAAAARAPVVRAGTPAPTRAPDDRDSTLEARVTELERWRERGGGA